LIARLLTKVLLNVSPNARKDDPVRDVNNDETDVHDNIENTVVHDANDTVASESSS